MVVDAAPYDELGDPLGGGEGVGGDGGFVLVAMQRAAV